MSDKYFSLRTGIVAAKSDAHHDFKSAYKSKLVEAELPNVALATDPSIKFIPTEKYMNAYVFAEGVKGNPLSIKAEMPRGQRVIELSTPNINSELSPEIVENYDVITFRNGKQDVSSKDEDVLVQGSSELQKMLQDMGVTTDVFIICDVAYSWVKKDLTNSNRSNKNQIFWWAQTLQTGFDPAGKVAWHRGKEYGFTDTNSNFRYCWQPDLENLCPKKEYSKWPIGEEAVDSNNEDAMLCLNKTLLMISELSSNKSWDYKDYSSYLIMFDEINKKYVYADKNMAAKEYKMSRGILASYYQKAKELLKLCISLLNRSPQAQTIEDFTLQYQMLAKRCGDMPQALACLDRSIKYQTLVNSSVKPSPTNIGLPISLMEEGQREVIRKGDDKGVDAVFQSNGNNMFISYDQIAVAQALNYHVPLVLYDQLLGVTLFVSKKLRTPLVRLSNILLTPDTALIQTPTFKFINNVVGEGGLTQQEEYTFMRNQFQGMDKLVNDDKITEMNDLLRRLVKAKSDFTSETGQVVELVSSLVGLQANNDEELQSLLEKYFSNLATIKMILSVGADLAQLDEILEQANLEFKVLTEIPGLSSDLRVFNKVGGEQGWELDSNVLNLGISKVFIRYIDETSNTLQMDNVDIFLERLSATITLYESTIKKLKGTLDQYESLIVEILFAQVLDTPKGVKGNILSISPSKPKSLRTGRNAENKIYSLSEEVFQQEKVMTPIVNCLVKIPQDSQLITLARHFRTQIGVYVNSLVSKSNSFSSTPVYQQVLMKALERLEGLLQLFDNQSQVGGAELGEKRSRFDDDNEVDDDFETQKRQKVDAIPDIFSESNSMTDIYELIGFIKNISSSSIEDLKFDQAGMSNILDYDEYLKNVFNILSFYFLYDLEHDKSDVLENLGLRQWFDVLARSYLKIEAVDLLEPEEIIDESENIYLFNALESQVMNGKVTINDRQNVSKMMYMYLNEVGNEGPNLYPDMDVELQAFGDQFHILLNEMATIDYEKLSKLMFELQDELVKEQNSLTSTRINEVSQKGMFVPSESLVQVYGGRRVKKTKSNKYKVKKDRKMTRVRRIKLNKTKKMSNKKGKRVF